MLEHTVQNIVFRTSNEPALIFYQRTLNCSSQLGTSREQLRESCKLYWNHVKSSDVFNVKDRVEILELE